jgi:hypothetical protein
MTLPTARDHSGEAGAVLPFVAILLVVLLGFAAFTVDFGYQYAERRQAQSAADSGALAAAVTAFTANGDLQSVVDDALQFSDANTKWTYQIADWTGCADPDALAWTAADLGLLPGTNCVSFNAGFSEIRVQLPETRINTFFARVIGFDTLPVTAAAQASIELPSGSTTPPFVVLSGSKAGDEVCLRTSSGGPMPGRWIGNGTGNPATQSLASEAGYLPDPCDDLPGTSQYFGTLNPYFYEDADPDQSPDTSCKQILSGIDVGIAEGIDHNLSTFEPDYPAGSDVRVDGNGCPGGPAEAWPNTMDTQTGFTAGVLRCGLLSSGGGTCANGPVLDGITYPPRLQRGHYAGSGPQFAGEGMENLPLWYFLDSDLQTLAAPSGCKDLHAAVTASDPQWDYFDKKEGMIACLAAWTQGSDGPLFNDDLLESGRFAIIPLVAEPAFDTSPVHFNSFVPVFFQKLYQQGNGQGNPDPMCFSQAESASGNAGWYWHEAGQGFDCGRSNQNVDRLAGIVLDCGMLPSDTCEPDVSPTSPGGEVIYRVLLTQ